MKWLIAGSGHKEFYETELSRALKRNGISVSVFRWRKYFTNVLTKTELQLCYSGLGARTLNNALIQEVNRLKPDVVFVWRGTHMSERALTQISHAGAYLIAFNNDDPFSDLYHKNKLFFRRNLWKNYLKTIPSYDLILCFRHHNIIDYKKYGARSIQLFLSYFIPEIHKPNTEATDTFQCDFVFAGHYENDDRIAYINAISREVGSVRIYGDKSWDKVKKLLHPTVQFLPSVFGEDYRAALTSARAALCFLSKLNRDDYTRRCFEIPACRQVLISERTPLLETLFIPNKEALFFSNTTELVDHAKKIKHNNAYRNEIATNALKSVWENGHDIDSRVKVLLSKVQEVIK